MPGFISKEDRKKATSDFRWGMGQTLILVVVIVVVVGILNATGLLFKGWFLDQENEVRRNSFQYEQTQRTMISEKITAYTRLETEVTELEANNGDATLIEGKRAQQKAFHNEICEKADLVDEDDLTDGQRSFLRRHPC